MGRFPGLRTTIARRLHVHKGHVTRVIDNKSKSARVDGAVLREINRRLAKNHQGQSMPPPIGGNGSKHPPEGHNYRSAESAEPSDSGGQSEKQNVQQP